MAALGFSRFGLHRLDTYSATPEIFEETAKYLKDNNIPVKTVKEGVALMNP